MSEKKEVFRVKRPWVGGPDLGTEIPGPIPAGLLPNVERVVVAVQANDSSTDLANAARDRIIEEAKAEAAKILDQARSDADGILNGAKAEAEKIVAEAKASNNGNKNNR